MINCFSLVSVKLGARKTVLELFAKIYWAMFTRIRDFEWLVRCRTCRNSVEFLIVHRIRRWIRRIDVNFGRRSTKLKIPFCQCSNLTCWPNTSSNYFLSLFNEQGQCQTKELNTKKTIDVAFPFFCCFPKRNSGRTSLREKFLFSNFFNLPVQRQNFLEPLGLIELFLSNEIFVRRAFVSFFARLSFILFKTNHDHWTST